MLASEGICCDVADCLQALLSDERTGKNVSWWICRKEPLPLSEKVEHNTYPPIHRCHDPPIRSLRGVH